MGTNQLAIIKEETVDAVARRIGVLQNSRELHLPATYSAQNALKSAWLILQEVVDKAGAPALSVCTRESIMNSLLDMVIQGLNPAKKQCYFVVFGKKLVLMRSYFGSIAVAKLVDPDIEDVVGETIYEGDKFKYQIRRGKKEITEHEQEFGSVDKKKIIGAYAEVIDREGKVKATEILTIDEIYQSWKRSKMNPFDEQGKVKSGSTHGKFTSDMARRTAINKVCKLIINSSNDSQILSQAVSRAADEMSRAEAEEQIKERANKGPVVDIDHGDPVDADFEEVQGAEDLPHANGSDIPLKTESERPAEGDAPY